MNNILSFNEYNGQELEVIAYENALNEGLRNFFNKRATAKVRSELADEIEMSKSIMDGIKEGLETLSDNFNGIQKDLEKSDENDKGKGEKQKLLEDISKIIKKSKESTWDLNQLIDEGEIDYAGFTANVGIASVAYFGILFTPFRAAIMIHKGYRYFFNIIKNTIRKALVMLQLNFDQFENLIICKGFQSADYAQDMRDMNTIADLSGKLQVMLFDKDRGSIKNKKTVQEVEKKYKIAMDAIKLQMQQKKSSRGSENAFTCLDQYNNTYTKSLEALRTYSQDDVQKHLDAIKASMNKLAGQEADLQIYSELIIAAAEEHAYKISTSIYNKFAKMSEVFSLPNQKKLIDLIQAATEEEMDAAEKRSKELEAGKLKEVAEKNEKDGLDAFKSLEGVEIGDIDENTNKYDESKIKGAEKWTYDEFINPDMDKDKRDILESWLGSHPEVLKKCDKTLQVYIDTPFKNSEYIDSLIDYIGPCLLPTEDVEEGIIFSFDRYLIESKKHKKKTRVVSKSSSAVSKSDNDESDKSLDTSYELSETEKSDLDDKIKDLKTKFTDLMTYAFGSDYRDKDEFDDEEKAKLNYIIKKAKEEDIDPETIETLEDFRNGIESKHSYFINFKNIDKSQMEDLKELFDNKKDSEEVPIIALEAIGEKVLKDKTFAKNSKYIVGRIRKCFDDKKVGVSLMVYIMLANSIKTLKVLRSQDYATIDANSDNGKSTEKKSGE